MNKNPSIFKASELKAGHKGWIVDLSPDSEVNPDCYWHFPSLAQARLFVGLRNSGLDNLNAEAIALSIPGKLAVQILKKA